MIVGARLLARHAHCSSDGFSLRTARASSSAGICAKSRDRPAARLLTMMRSNGRTLSAISSISMLLARLKFSFKRVQAIGMSDDIESICVRQPSDLRWPHPKCS